MEAAHVLLGVIEHVVDGQEDGLSGELAAIRLAEGDRRAVLPTDSDTPVADGERNQYPSGLDLLGRADEQGGVEILSRTRRVHRSSLFLDGSERRVRRGDEPMVELLFELPSVVFIHERHDGFIQFGRAFVLQPLGEHFRGSLTGELRATSRHLGRTGAVGGDQQMPPRGFMEGDAVIVLAERTLVGMRTSAHACGEDA